MILLKRGKGTNNILINKSFCHVFLHVTNDFITKK